MLKWFYILKCVNDVQTLNYWWITHAPLFLEESAIANSILSTAFYNKIMHTKTWKFISMIRSLHYIDIKVSNLTIKRLHFYDQTFALYWHKVFNPTIKRFHFYDQTFALYRHKVSNPTIKRFYSFDETFPFLYGKHYVVKRDLHFDKTKSPQNILNYAFHH